MFGKFGKALGKVAKFTGPGLIYKTLKTPKGPELPKASFGGKAYDQLGSVTAENLKDPGLGPNASQHATEQVQNNAILGGLFGKGGELEKSIGKEQQLQNQGFQLTPEDQTMYGQTSGDIARMFGQQGNKTAANLASRGLSSSGAAGAAFSGLAGNQNEMLAQAQQQIMQQRFQNTMNQIKQQQQFIGQLGQQGENAIQDQFGRQLSAGHERYSQALGTAEQERMKNQQTADYGQAAAEFKAKNKPMSMGDYLRAGVGSTIYNVAGAPGKMASSTAGAAGKSLGGGLFGG